MLSERKYQSRHDDDHHKLAECMIQNLGTTDADSIGLKPVLVRDLPELYTIYFDSFPRLPAEDTIPSALPNRKAVKLTLIRAIAIHLLHIFLGRLTYAHDQADPWSVLRGRGDMKPFLIMRGNSPVGCCFLLRHNSEVWELGIIGVTSNMKRKGIGLEAVREAKRYVAAKGGKRIVVRASGIRSTTGFFLRCGFQKAYSEDHFILNMEAGTGVDSP